MENKLKFDFATTQMIIQKISFIDNFRGKWEAIENKKSGYLNELRQIATIQSIGSSTRIEGAKLTDKEIEKLIGHVKVTKFKSRDEEEVVGYYETLEFVYENYKEIKITENNILYLHKLVLKHSRKDKHHKGNYKKLPNKVVANYPDGTQKIIFNTTPPHLTAPSMHNIISWSDEKFKNKEIHPLLIISTFVYEFLSIHPFQDGNGRLSRIITTWLLLQSGYRFLEYVSFENHIEQHKKEYYKVLMNAQKQRGTKKEIISDWVLFFLSSIEAIIQKLNKKYEQLQTVREYLNVRQKKIIAFISQSQPVRLGEIANKFSFISVNTIKKDLKYLTNNNFIVPAGKLKSTHYSVRET